MTKSERFLWVIIYLNMPLIIAVAVLFFAFNQKAIVMWLLAGNIVLLTVGSYLRWRKQARSC